MPQKLVEVFRFGVFSLCVNLFPKPLSSIMKTKDKTYDTPLDDAQLRKKKKGTAVNPSNVAMDIEDEVKQHSGTSPTDIASKDTTPTRSNAPNAENALSNKATEEESNLPKAEKVETLSNDFTLVVEVLKEDDKADQQQTKSGAKDNDVISLQRLQVV